MKTPRFFEGKSLTINGTLIVSETTYSGINEASGGIQREFLLSNGKDSISLDLSEIKSKPRNPDDYAKYNGEFVVVEGVMSVPKEGYNSVIKADTIAIMPKGGDALIPPE